MGPQVLTTDPVCQDSMKKHTIELIRRLKHIKGYGIFPTVSFDSRPADSEIEVLNRIVEWSSGKNVSIYKHVVRWENENISTTDFYTVDLPQVPISKIPYCDYVCYLDIYYQDK